MVIKIWADGADLIEMKKVSSQVSGFTTNPTLMRKAGVTDYLSWAKEAVKQIDKPLSFEVFSDDFSEMYRQAKILSNLGEQVYVKIPITNTRQKSSIPLIKELSEEGIKVNVTAVFTKRQAWQVSQKLSSPAIISIFAGRIADTGVDPVPICKTAKRGAPEYVEILWASTRELFNICQATKGMCDIITIPNDLLSKMHLLGKDLPEYSLETVRMFYKDGQGFTL